MSEFDAEWTQIKKDVAAANVTKLAHADGGGSGGSGGVQSSAAEWQVAAGAVKGLVVKVQTAGKGIAGQPALVQDPDFEDCVEMYISVGLVNDSWTDYLARVQQRCKELGEQLGVAGDIQARNDEQTGSAFTRYHERDEQRLADAFNGLDDHPGYGDTDYMPAPIIAWEG